MSGRPIKRTLRPRKTQVVYCKDNVRRGLYPNHQVDFLGYSFRPRRSMNRWGKTFVNFSPGISNQAATAIRQTIRDWQLRCRIDKRIDDLVPLIFDFFKKSLVIWGHRLERCAVRTASPSRGSRRLCSST